MVSSILAAHPAYMRGESSARQFVLGRSLPVREEGLKGLNLVGFPLDVARKVIAIDDWGPRVVGLQAAATYHAQIREGAMAAAIAVVVRELFEAAAERAPEEIRSIARQAIASIATDFSYGVLRAGCPDDAVAWADGLTPKLLAWGKTDAGLTVETLAAEALWTTDRFDAAFARLPKTGPSDEAGRLRYERLRRLLEGMRPDAPDPESPAAQYARALAALATLHAIIPKTPEYAAIREKVANGRKEERERALPETEDDLLERATFLIELLKEAQELGIGVV
jgi:hypothetical protein